jgi:membrane protease YdiL (CAAX protease family)
MNDEQQTDGEEVDPQSGGPAVTATTVDEIPVPHTTDDLGSEMPPQPPVVDPDHPGWGPGAGIAVWLLSVGATILVPGLALLVWLLISLARGMPAPATDQEVVRWATTPGSLAVQVWANLPAHVLTLAVCWFVATRGRTRSFFASVGWGWAGRTPLYWAAFSGLIIVGLYLASIVIQLVLPEAEDSAFDTLVKSTFAVRLALAVVATASAPLVEELVYRGVLYGGLRSKLGTVATVIIVTLLFSSVHASQYWGRWASMATLTLLSLALTTMRAASQSVLPSVLLHLIFNSIQSVVILMQGGSGQGQSQ